MNLPGNQEGVEPGHREEGGGLISSSRADRVGEAGDPEEGDWAGQQEGVKSGTRRREVGGSARVVLIRTLDSSWGSRESRVERMQN